ncbi:hypothetical protein ACKLNR_011029 [Fusarium oxysporum f. sp. zingiberi]
MGLQGMFSLGHGAQLGVRRALFLFTFPSQHKEQYGTERHAILLAATARKTGWMKDIDDVHADNEDPRLENKEQHFCHRSPHLKSKYARGRRLSRRTTVNSLAGG